MKWLISLLLVIGLFCSPVHAAGILDNFEQQDLDTSGTTIYTLYVSSQGGWVIKAQEQKILGGSGVTNYYRVTWSYVNGLTNYQGAWANRESLTGATNYKTYPEAF